MPVPASRPRPRPELVLWLLRRGTMPAMMPPKPLGEPCRACCRAPGRVRERERGGTRACLAGVGDTGGPAVMLPRALHRSPRSPGPGCQGPGTGRGRQAAFCPRRARAEGQPRGRGAQGTATAAPQHWPAVPTAVKLLWTVQPAKNPTARVAKRCSLHLKSVEDRHQKFKLLLKLFIEIMPDSFFSYDIIARC